MNNKCEHGKRKNRCKECSPQSFCNHGREKYRCMDCEGVSICEHKKRKDSCKLCGSNSFCKHNIQKVFCIECDGSCMCEHKIRKYQCKQCNGSSFCEHGKRKNYCKDCKDCKDCKGSQICIHDKEKRLCKECDGSLFCDHGKNKYRCKICDGRSLCKTPLCEVRGIPKYKGYCLTCCIQNCPDIKVVCNYKTKEKEVFDCIKEEFPDFTFVVDKKIKDGCSSRRPDILLDMGSHVIIIEVDENKHSDYICENKRLMEISLDLHFRPVVFIRFNPDSYINEQGKLIKSCWGTNKLGIIPKTKRKEWDERINHLKTEIKYWVDNPTTKTIEIIKLFY